ncbi:Kelch repeat-containing protein [Longirhabdus pacifica]|uniref:Kelch repeat-containing protein n=1 Tax=Longirhabdus pacifica TaxID=2305227 RepID=UPI001008C969|nr:kelch repeat-containing protein [Longirhabdus pacifica]
MKKLFSLLLMMAMVFTIVPVAMFAADSGGTWETGTPMTTARYGHGVAEVNGKIYVIGGYSSDIGHLNTVEMYNPETNTWTTKSPMPTSRLIFGTAVVNGKIYAIGGQDKNLNRLDVVEMYDPDTDSWTTKSPMPTKRHSPGVEEINGNIYVIGGYSQNSKNLTTVEMYDPYTDDWETMNSMPTERRLLDVAVSQSKIYAFGGFSDSGYLNIIEEYSPDTDSWTTKSPMPTKRSMTTSVVLKNKIYVIGGHNYDELNEDMRLDTVEVYDPNSNSWETKEKMITGRSHAGSVILNNKIYVLGGLSNTTELNTVEIYTPESEVDAPLNLTATGGNAKVTLNWTEVTEADTYNVYRSLTSGGPYTSVATNVYSTSYVDSPLTNGTTYYYVVTAVNENGESAYSNEASATPQADDNNNRAILTIILNSGLLKEYDVSMSEVNQFMTWYESKSSLFYQFEKDYNLGSDISRTDYVVHDMIELFEVREYEAK